MTFEDIMRRMLHVLQNGRYVPYVNGGGTVPALTNIRRSDYDDVREDEYAIRYIHGGIDFYYGEVQYNGELKSLRPGDYPNNQKPFVFAPVSGLVIARDNAKGTVSILGDDGYVHSIMHMTDLNQNLIVNQTRISTSDIGILELGKMYHNGGVRDNHVHYEISTYKGVPYRQQKIDPEAYWNSYGTIGTYYALVGSAKQSNTFYGTNNNEIIKGEGCVGADAGSVVDPIDSDRLYGGGGSDIISGGDGNDTLFGGNEFGQKEYYKIENGKLKTKRDGIKEDADDSPDTLIGGMGQDSLDGGKGNDLLIGGTATISENLVVTYNAEEDTIDTSNNTLKGGDGDDILYGGAGDDILEGGKDDDLIFGGKGNDTIKGGEGEDILQGGEGHDTYYIDFYEGGDSIEDKEGINTVIFCGKRLNVFYAAGSYYFTPDKKNKSRMVGYRPSCNRYSYRYTSYPQRKLPMGRFRDRFNSSTHKSNFKQPHQRRFNPSRFRSIYRRNPDSDRCMGQCDCGINCLTGTQ